MSALPCNNDEREVLIDILEAEIKDLRHEVHDTDDHDYREELKNRERIIKGILQKLQAISTEGAAA